MCDQDDRWSPEKVEHMAEKFDDEAVVYCYSDARIINQEGKMISEGLWKKMGRKESLNSQEEFLYESLMGRFPHGCTVAIRKELYNKVIPFKLLHDNWFAITATFYGKVVAGIID